MWSPAGGGGRKGEVRNGGLLEPREIFGYRYFFGGTDLPGTNIILGGDSKFSGTGTF